MLRFAAWALGLGLVILASPACSSECGRFADRFSDCLGAPGGIVSTDNVRMFCMVVLNTPPEPGDKTGIYGHWKSVIADCMPKTGCADFTACLDQKGCRLLFKHPSDLRPTFDCWPKPKEK